MKIISRFPQVLVRGAKFSFALAAGLSEFVFQLRRAGKHRDQLELAKWCQRTAQSALTALEVTIMHEGTIPQRGMLACNHLSYLDILVLAATSPSTFVSKYQVKYWPIFGWFGILSGTLFLRRERKSHAVEIAGQFQKVVESGSLLALFPEGTSTDGSIVKPFHSTLFQPAVKHRWPVTPAWLSYEVSEGKVERDVCFIDDMLFLPHFLNLLAGGKVQARLVFGQTAPTELKRKELAKYLHNQVCRLAAENSGCERFANPQVEWTDEVEPTLEPVVNLG